MSKHRELGDWVTGREADGQDGQVVRNGRTLSGSVCGLWTYDTRIVEIETASGERVLVRV